MPKMLAKKLVANAVVKKNIPISIIQGATYSTGGFHDERRPIGKREWVCYGLNSTPHYIDRPDFPMPAVRFKEITGDLIALREKEKGDWKNLTLDEKKKLYRASFRQTLIEEAAPTGEWKSVLGWALGLIAIGLGTYIWEKMFIYRPLPPSFSEQWRRDAFRKAIDNKDGHITGLASKWDYEKDDWKK